MLLLLVVTLRCVRDCIQYDKHDIIIPVLYCVILSSSVVLWNNLNGDA